MSWAEAFAGRKALVTGGMGFIGSNLAIELARAGAEVTVVDAMIPGYGGNLFNVAPVRDAVTLNFADIRDANTMNYLIRGQDFVFHLAGQVDHVLSLTDPFPDIDMNIRGTAVVMEACKKHNPGARVIYTGTRGQYGPAVKLPVDESAPTSPKGIYEISRLSAEKIVQVYHDIHGVRSVLLRLTNVYGERAQMRHSRYGVVNWFVRLAIDGDAIQVFGDGSILRDYLYVGDCVRALLQCAASDAAYGEVFNVGVDRPTTFVELAETLIAVAGSGSWQFAPFSPERKAQEPGDYYSDIGKIRRLVGWSPTVGLEEGLRRTVDYYRRHRSEYW
ncbi:MAG TPA: NAD-dependent epimerase/dehydratase family protein [Thermoanaerobaculia bacterium]|jgi:UDP-glucose 4-epimerase